ncbi:type I pantothenate kinase [Bacillus gobiensis]|uniref:type I pantothenate kinase n=1 Tax=Bacillus gobiensis TaxID=1441095 RepID=UPI003D1FF30D
MNQSNSSLISLFTSHSRQDWRKLGMPSAIPIKEKEMDALKGVNVSLSLSEVKEIYVPFVQLLNIHIMSYFQRQRGIHAYLNNQNQRQPFIIGIAGSVAVGKSTTARILQTLLSRMPWKPKVSLITTDGFLYPNKQLAEKGLMLKKGFPESYDVKRLLGFLSEIKAGKKIVRAPVYSHLTYDRVPGSYETIEDADVVIIEGINVLQTPPPSEEDINKPRVFVSDFFNYSIYVDAEEKLITTWYIERFLKLRETAFQDPESYFHRYKDLSDDEAIKFAQNIWTKVNRPNLQENILPTKYRADFILKKGIGHRGEEILVRNI